MERYFTTDVCVMFLNLIDTFAKKKQPQAKQCGFHQHSVKLLMRSQFQLTASETTQNTSFIQTYTQVLNTIPNKSSFLFL